PAAAPCGASSDPLDFSASVSRASASLVRRLVSEPWPPAPDQSVTPATVKLGSSLNSMAPGEAVGPDEEACASVVACKRRSSCFFWPTDNNGIGSVTHLPRPSFSTVAVYVPA